MAEKERERKRKGYYDEIYGKRPRQSVIVQNPQVPSESTEFEDLNLSNIDESEFNEAEKGGKEKNP